MKRLFRFRKAWLALALVVPALTGCKDEELQGTYTATSFTYATTGAAAKDVLAAGGSITLTIFNNFTTSGTMSIPASVTGGSAVQVSLLGEASRQGDQVTLQLITDSLLDGIVLTHSGGSLTGTAIASGTTITVTLSR